MLAHAIQALTKYGQAVVAVFYGSYFLKYFYLKIY
jgi:hypothetical protein